MTEDRLPSGDAGLDAVLDGGLPLNSIALVMGRPGSGKTILAQQYCFRNATEARPALYLSTASEPYEKILRFGETLTFFDSEAVGRSVLYEDLGAPLVEGGLEAVIEAVRGMIVERRPGIIVIDSFKALGAFADRTEFRRFLRDLAALLSTYPATTFWVGEYGEEELDAPEFAVADVILSAAPERRNEREIRFLQVFKLRGGGFLSGKHAYRLSEQGLRVFPRLSDPRRESDYELASERTSSGLAALDEMLDDGYWPGSATLVAGPSGAGKTLLSLHFATGGAAAGEPCVMATLQEDKPQLTRVAAGFGWSLEDGMVEVLYRSPNDVYIDEWVYEVLAAVERLGAKRVVIDSLTDLQFAAPEPVRFREFIYSIHHRLSRAGVSLMMTTEVPELFGLRRLGEYGLSHLSDNVILLQYALRGDSLGRSIAVLKSRATAHSPLVRSFEITDSGVVIGEPVAAKDSI